MRNRGLTGSARYVLIVLIERVEPTPPPHPPRELVVTRLCSEFVMPHSSELACVFMTSKTDVIPKLSRHPSCQPSTCVAVTFRSLDHVVP